MKSSAACVAFACVLGTAAPVAAQSILPGPWSGFYIGGHAGAGFNPNKLDFGDLSSNQDLGFQTSNSNDKFLGGVQAGYDWQTGGLLLGVEGDVSFAKDIDYVSTVRGRIGVPAGSFLVYGTGGMAFEGAPERFTVFQPDSPAIYNFNRTVNKTGWTAGGGIETMIAPGISLGVEGLYYGLGRDSTVITVQGPPVESFTVSDDRNFAVVRARVSYHFGWW